MPTRADVSPAGALEATAPVPPKAGHVLSSPIVHRAATQHCRFFCRWCGSAILLAHERIGLPFAGPYLRRIEVRSVAAVCSSCSHVSNFSLFRGSPGFDTRHGLVPAEPRGEVVLLDWLKCHEESCSYPLPLFVQTQEPLAADDVPELASRWNWSEMCCAMGHRILTPTWIFGRPVYRFPAPIR